MASISRVPVPRSTRLGLDPMTRQPQNIWHIVSAMCRSRFLRIVFGIMASESGQVLARRAIGLKSTRLHNRIDEV
jgi:hypothetical protein